MRRTDREVTDAARIDAIIEACDCCRVGFADGEDCYIVPLNFGFAYENGHRTFYFHGAMEGRKMELLRRGSAVGFELDTNHGVNAGEQACGYSFRYQSVIGRGTAALLKTPAEKQAALNQIMRRYSGRMDWQFPSLEKVAVWKLAVQELSCKEHP